MQMFDSGKVCGIRQFFLPPPFQATRSSDATMGFSDLVKFDAAHILPLPQRV
jgi:hypothetical protein